MAEVAEKNGGSEPIELLPGPEHHRALYGLPGFLSGRSCGMVAPHGFEVNNLGIHQSSGDLGSILRTPNLQTYHQVPQTLNHKS